MARSKYAVLRPNFGLKARSRADHGIHTFPHVAVAVRQLHIGASVVQAN
jgi:hypothetical protein